MRNNYIDGLVKMDLLNTLYNHLHVVAKNLPNDNHPDYERVMEQIRVILGPISFEEIGNIVDMAAKMEKVLVNFYQNKFEEMKQYE